MGVAKIGSQHGDLHETDELPGLLGCERPGGIVAAQQRAQPPNVKGVVAGAEARGGGTARNVEEERADAHILEIDET
jgi:hypothetical protein